MTDTMESVTDPCCIHCHTTTPPIDGVVSCDCGLMNRWQTAPDGSIYTHQAHPDGDPREATVTEEQPAPEPEPSCGNCRYSRTIATGQHRALKIDPTPSITRCHYNAPSEHYTLWPKVERDDWCGQHRPKIKDPAS